MKTKQVDILNMGLIIIALVIAIKLPFKLFLFSYAVLGPLHYLTEINWLNEKKYFIQSKIIWAYVFVSFAFIKSINPIGVYLGLKSSSIFKPVLEFLNTNDNLLLLIGFLFAICLVYFQDIKKLISGFIVSIVFGIIIIHYTPETLLFLGIFLPTLIHVYVFTLLFILYGAIKSQSKMGFILSFLLVSVPIIIIYLPIDPRLYTISDNTTTTFINSNILSVSSTLAHHLDLMSSGTFQALSAVGIKIQIFIAFAYTYHYLNWFSKTSIIGWQKALTQRKAVGILTIWVISILLYMYDFKTGFTALFFLSFLHVFLELPLNIITIKAIITNPFKKG